MTATISDLAGLLNEHLPQLSVEAVERKRWFLEFFDRQFQAGDTACRWKVNNSGNTAEQFVEGQAEPAPGQQGYIFPFLTWSNYRVKVKVEKMAIEDNRGDVPILEDILVREMRGGEADLTNLIQNEIYGTDAGVGMLLAVDAAGTYAGIDRSVNTEWQSVEAAVGGGAETDVQTALDAVKDPARQGERASHIICNRTEARVIGGFSSTNQSLRITQDDAGRIQPGGTGVTNVGGFTGSIYDSAHVVEAPGFAANTVLYINKDDWTLVTHRDFLVEPFKRELDALETVISWRGVLKCSHPFRQAKDTGF